MALEALKHGLEPIFPVVEGLEVTRRIKHDVTSGKKKIFYFLLNQSGKELNIKLPFKAKNLISKKLYESGEETIIPISDVLILECV